MTPPFPQALPPQPPQTKKSGNGCLIALAIVGALVVLVLGLGALGVYRFSQSKEGKVVFGAIGGITKLMYEAQRAPGTNEVRALGCVQAFAMDVDAMSKILESFDAAMPTDHFSIMVVCQAPPAGRSAPTCGEVARTYLGAAGPPERGFVVQVTHGGQSSIVCSTLYTPDGTRVRDLAPGSAPSLPTGAGGGP